MNGIFNSEPMLLSSICINLIRFQWFIHYSNLLFDFSNPLPSSATLPPCLWVCGSENAMLNVWYEACVYLNPIICPIRELRARSVVSSFVLTSLEITTPIRRLFPDILPSKLRSGWFYFSHQRIVSPFQINIHPEDVWVLALIFPFSTEQSQNLLWTQP